MQIKSHSSFVERLVESKAWESPFSLIDVGASGGIGAHWSVFGDTIEAVGFDPYVTEVQRLNAEEQRPHVKYEAAFVGAAAFDALFPSELRDDRIRSRTNDPFPRVSASLTMQLLHEDYARDAYNRGAPAVMTTRHITLDDYVPEAEGPDFIKVDTDGHDIEVLVGAERLIRSHALGLMVECQFHGALHPYANTFANIDTFLRERGFSLFDLDVNRYSRSTLPAPFMYAIPAQTTSGQALWGDAVYFRDLADPDYEVKHAFAATNDRVAKLAALFALFGVPDCAAELLVNRANAFPQVLRRALQDLLPSELGRRDISYADYVSSFKRDPRSFYPKTS